MDEYQSARSHLYVQGRRQVLANARVLHPGQHHQVSAHTRRSHRHGEGGGAAEATQSFRDEQQGQRSEPEGWRTTEPWPRRVPRQRRRGWQSKHESATGEQDQQQQADE